MNDDFLMYDDFSGEYAAMTTEQAKDVKDGFDAVAAVIGAIGGLFVAIVAVANAFSKKDK